MLEHLVPAILTAFCGFLIRESYSKATKQISRRLQSGSEEVEGVPTSLLSLPGQQSAVLLAQEHHLNLEPYYPGYLQSLNSHSIHLPGLNISYPVNPLFALEPSFAHDHNCGYFHNSTATENVLIHEGEYSLPNLPHNPLQRGSDIFTVSQRLALGNVSRPQEFRNLNTLLFQNQITQDEVLPIVLRTLLIEREKQIQMLAGMLSKAITRPGIYAETYQNHRNTLLNTNSDTPKYDLRGAKFSGGFAETVQDKQIGGSQYNYALTEEQTIAQAVEAIQQLLKQLSHGSVY